MAAPATPDDYYDHTPEPGHSTGDIWCGLPSYGTLKHEHVAGIVITPACDLQNSKSETITYLPVLSFESWFATFSMLAEIRSTTQGLWKSLAEQRHLEPFELPSMPSLAVLSDLQKRLETVENDAKGRLKERILAGIGAMRSILQPSEISTEAGILNTLFGEKVLAEKCERLITNAHRTDTHFLPARGRWAVPEDDLFSRHSLAMFRYPLTAPLDILDLANDPTCGEWAAAIAQYESLPATRFFATRKPLRVARLRPRFFADLLSRYTALYARVGSPDFSPVLVSRLASEVCTSRKT